VSTVPTLFVPREAADSERRVAATPDSVKRFTDAGVTVRIQTGAGVGARYRDDSYAEAGAEIVVDPDDGWGSADLVCTVGPPDVARARSMRPGSVLVGLLAPHRHLGVVRALSEQGATALAMELVPRISRAQRMDALSSQANIAGYRAVILASWLAEKQFPLSMTAAGTIKPATVVVLGAGVAGLQAIATARRLGAVVRANDIREAAKGEVESIGGEFIAIEDEGESDAEGAGGYAKEVGEDFLARQRRILGDHLAGAHAVITTAFVPGRPAPTLVTAEMVERMQPGSVLVDIAAAEGGNCALTDGDRTVDHAGVQVVGAPNLPSTVPGEASSLYARNIFELGNVLIDDGQVRIDTEDEIIATALLVRDGEVVHAPTADLLAKEGQS
jgi:H+-translocating NAD(P) transhydrogenase subunit alpha